MNAPPAVLLVSPSGIIPPGVEEILQEFGREHGGDAQFWVRTPNGWIATPSPVASAEPGPDAVEVAGGGGTELRVEVTGLPEDEARRAARFLAATLARGLRHDAEARFFMRELTERYEEITLLYSISEILGSVISLEQATATILTEVAGVVGARRAALWVHDSASGTLYLAASVGGNSRAEPIPVDDACSVTAEVFREGRPTILGPGDEHPRGDCDPFFVRRESFLSVPISYSPPEGETRTVGVINLVGRTSDELYSAGDLKLLSAIASQIGAAVENGRLIAATLHQERIVREMELAHDLQLKLLPRTEPFAGYAEVAARCAPAESVGGDFYHLFRLGGGRLGVVIGDVSSHGFSAALIMALTMSAVAIHASEGDPPSEVLRRVHRALIDELQTTEMYLTLFYGVIDPAAGRIVYANAGHAHAFRLADGEHPERLGATNPPLGVVDLDEYVQAEAPWQRGEDVLFLFTDGLSDALEAGEIEGERMLLDAVRAARGTPPEALIERIFELGDGGGAIPADDRTAVFARI